jgi:phosphate-selective porin OprO/OprP
MLWADYVYNDRNAESNATRSFENIGSLNFWLEEERWGIGADISAATGYGKQSDTWGFAIEPFYNITKDLQVVARYTHVESDGANGVRFARYENALTGGRGDEYDEVYAGLNYYIYGHKLKLQTGFTYTQMKDAANDGGALNGWTATTAFRIYF